MNRYTDAIDQRLTARHKKCIEFCGNLKGKKILNIGSYNGWFEKFASENGCTEVVGIDTDRKNLLSAQRALKQNNIKFVELSVLDLGQFETNSFDMVTMFDVLEHLPKNTHDKCMSEIRRVLKNESELIMSVPNNAFFSNLLDPAWYFGHRHYSKGHIVNILAKNEFEITVIDYGGKLYELFSMILLYFFKWVMRRDMPFKQRLEKKRHEEYLMKNGFVTLFVRGRKL